MNDNFWGYLITGMEGIAGTVLNTLPHHTDIGMDAMVKDLAGAAPILAFVLVDQFIGLRVPFLIWTTILVLEGARAAIAAYHWVKNAIPFLG